MKLKHISIIISLIACSGTSPVTAHANKPLIAVSAAGFCLSALPATVYAARQCDKGDWGCGKGVNDGQPYWTQTCSTSDCCCRSEDGTGLRGETCRDYSIKKGCGSCMGNTACKHVFSTVKIGDESCVNDDSCYRMQGNSVIWNYSCRGEKSCGLAYNVVIGPNSCGTAGKTAGYMACYMLYDSTVGSNSCREERSCYESLSCDELYYGGARLTIGDNACNLPFTCSVCPEGSIVPNGACSTPGGDDVQWVTECDGYWKCKYCMADNNLVTVSASYGSNRRRLESTTTENLEMECEELAGALLDYTDKSIEEHTAFREFISDHSCNMKYKNAFEFIADETAGTCILTVKKLYQLRGLIGDEPTALEHIQASLKNIDAPGFTQNYLHVTNEEFECEGDTRIKGGKSGKSAPAQAQAIDESKSGKSGSGKEEQNRKRQPNE